MSGADRKWLTVILALAFFARVVTVFLFFADYTPINDAAQWERAARNFLNGYGLIVSEDLKAYRTPVPGLYIAAIYAVCGLSVRAVQVANIFLGVFTVWLVYDLVRRAFDVISARWAAVFVAFYPLFLLYTGQLLSETPVLLLVALALWLIWLVHDRPALWFAPAGVVLGLAALTRETMLPIGILIALWTCIDRLSKRWPQRMSPAVVILAFIGLTLTPWTIRNYMMTGKFIPLTSLGGGSLWVANNPLADGTAKGLRSPQIDALPESQRGVAYRKMAVQFIRENPGRFVQLTLRRLQYFWHLTYHGEGLGEIAFLVVYLPMLSLAAIGVWAGWQLDRYAVLLLLTIPISLTVLHMIFLPTGRYRLPAELVVCMLAGVGATRSFSEMLRYLRATP